LKAKQWAPKYLSFGKCLRETLCTFVEQLLQISLNILTRIVN
jgi:hypothetical protein